MHPSPKLKNQNNKLSVSLVGLPRAASQTKTQRTSSRTKEEADNKKETLQTTTEAGGATAQETATKIEDVKKDPKAARTEAAPGLIPREEESKTAGAATTKTTVPDLPTVIATQVVIVIAILLKGGGRATTTQGNPPDSHKHMGERKTWSTTTVTTMTSTPDVSTTPRPPPATAEGVPPLLRDIQQPSLQNSERDCSFWKLKTQS